ncbi:MAG: toll/interleukin-1 receptor domain-containing protein, partial [Planctomycetota bacterium]
MMSDNSVFISYRRGNGGDIARIVQEFLEGQGFDVFLDLDGLGSGHFDDQLLTQIAARRGFIFICSEGSLDRCVNEGDWVRREIVHALKTGRHMVPFVMPLFVWPTSDALPQEMAEFQRHNSFEYSHSHWKHIKPKLAEMLRA